MALPQSSSDGAAHFSFIIIDVKRRRLLPEKGRSQQNEPSVHVEELAGGSMIAQISYTDFGSQNQLIAGQTSGLATGIRWATTTSCHICRASQSNPKCPISHGQDILHKEDIIGSWMTLNGNDYPISCATLFKPNRSSHC